MLKWGMHFRNLKDNTDDVSRKDQAILYETFR